MHAPRTTRTNSRAEYVYHIHGQNVSMPVIVRDAGSGNAMFMVPAAAVQRLLPDEAFEVVEMAPGETQLILGFVDYRDNDLGDYDEVAIIFTVRPRGSTTEPEGTFIYKLPVNQAFTCDAGCKIWGFPKSVEQIGIQYAGDRVTCTLEMDGQHVLTLGVPRGTPEAGAPPELEMTTYTYLDGPTAIPFTTGGRGTAVSAGGEGVTLALGTHRLAGELRSLGLPKAPFMSTWTEHMHGTFGAPRKL